MDVSIVIQRSMLHSHAFINKAMRVRCHTNEYCTQDRAKEVDRGEQSRGEETGEERRGEGKTRQDEPCGSNTKRRKSERLLLALDVS